MAFHGKRSLPMCVRLFLLMPMLFHGTVQRQFDNDADNGIGGGGRGGDSAVFSCYTCNVQAGQQEEEEEDEGTCNERAEECPALSALLPAAPFNSCSTLLQFTDGFAASRPAVHLRMTDAVSVGGASGRARVRKFCTSAGSAELLAPLLTRLAENGGAAGVCQSLDSWTHLSADPLLPFIVEGTARARPLWLPHTTTNGGGRRQRRRDRSVTVPTGEEQQKAGGRVGRGAVGPPAPPNSQFTSSSLLCVCTKSLCNEGDFEDILSRSIYVAGMDDKSKFVAESSTDENNTK